MVTLSITAEPSSVALPLVAAIPTKALLLIAIVCVVPIALKVPGVPEESGAICALKAFPLRTSLTQYGCVTVAVPLAEFAPTVAR